MPRQARLDHPGTLHHVMIRGIEKKRIVRDQQDRKDFVRRLGLLAVETETAFVQLVNTPTMSLGMACR